MSCINEKKVCKLITNSRTDVVNLFDDYIQWSNGYAFINFNYDHCTIISKLFKKGVLKNYKNITSSKNFDFEKLLEYGKENEAEATQTPFMVTIGPHTYCIFKINGKYYFYDKELVDVFQHVEYKATSNINNQNLYDLRVYNDNNLVGFILPARDNHEGTQDTLKELESQVGD